MVFSFSGLINSLYSSCIRTLCGGHSWSLSSLHGDSLMWSRWSVNSWQGNLVNTVSFQSVWGGGSYRSWRGHRRSLWQSCPRWHCSPWPRCGSCQHLPSAASWAWGSGCEGEADQCRVTSSCHLQGVCGVCQYCSPRGLLAQDNEELGRDDGPMDGTVVTSLEHLTSRPTWLL